MNLVFNDLSFGRLYIVKFFRAFSLRLASLIYFDLKIHFCDDLCPITNKNKYRLWQRDKELWTIRHASYTEFENRLSVYSSGCMQ